MKPTPDGHINCSCSSCLKYEIKRLRAENQRLREALRLQDPRNASECFERIAADFQRKTGFMAPGKDVHPAMSYGQEDDDKRRALWRPFVNEWHEHFFDATLAGEHAGAETEREKKDPCEAGTCNHCEDCGELEAYHPMCGCKKFVQATPSPSGDGDE